MYVGRGEVGSGIVLRTGQTSVPYQSWEAGVHGYGYTWVLEYVGCWCTWDMAVRGVLVSMEYGCTWGAGTRGIWLYMGCWCTWNMTVRGWLVYVRYGNT